LFLPRRSLLPGVKIDDDDDDDDDGDGDNNNNDKDKVVTSEPVNHIIQKNQNIFTCCQSW